MHFTHRFVDGSGKDYYLKPNGEEVLVTMTTVHYSTTGELDSDEVVFTHYVVPR